MAACYTGGTTTIGNAQICGIYKNGVELKYTIAPTSANGASTEVVIEDIANGSDAYTVSIYLDVNSGTATVDGRAIVTYFMGHWISA